MTFSYELLLMDASNVSSVQALDATLRTYQDRWPIGMDGEKVSTESMLLTYYDDCDIFFYSVSHKKNNSRNIGWEEWFLEREEPVVNSVTYVDTEILYKGENYI